MSATDVIMTEQALPVAVQAFEACTEIALALAAEASPCCIVGNLNAKLEASEVQHGVAFELANKKSVEVVQLGSDLSAARTKVTGLELRVRALKDQATQLRDELEPVMGKSQSHNYGYDSDQV